MVDLFPAEDFDDWAKNYDQSVFNTESFPFTGYKAVLDKVVELAGPRSDMRVLDLGIGTGNLASRFDAFGCEIWGTDFSAAMLEKARMKLPLAHLFQVDLREDWPAVLDSRFECIVSAYVFHHFEMEEKVHLAASLVQKRLQPGGSLIIADIAFHNQDALEAVKNDAGEEWEDEYYWLADQTIIAFGEAGLDVKYHSVSSCGGVFDIR